MLGILFTAGVGLAQFTGTVWENTPDASNASDTANMAANLPSAQFVSTAIQFCSVPGGEPGCPATSAYNVSAFLNFPVFSNQVNAFDPNQDMGAGTGGTEVQLAGSIYLTAGDNNFMIGHDDGFTMQISGGPGTVTCSTQSGLLCVNTPGTSAFASTPFTITATVAGIYNFTLNYSECCGPPAYLLFAYANGAPVGSAQIFKSFGASSVPLAGTTSLSFAVLNPNAQGSLTSIAFSDSLPAGLIVTSLATGSCGGGAITAVPGSSTVSLAGATLAAGASCTFSVNVIGTSVGTQNNSVTVTSNIGMGNTATASVAVEAPPAISKAFGAPTLPLGGTTSLSFIVANPIANPLTLMGIAFTDTLPAGLAVATPNGLTGSCGGGAITATAGSSTVSLSGAGLAPGATCSFSVNVIGVSEGVENNAVTVSSTNGGAGNTALATLIVLAVPTFTKAFSPSTIFQSQTSTLTFTITNPNVIPTTGLAFTDAFPSGVLGVTVNSDTCGGTASLVVGPPSSLSLSGGTVAAGSSCTITTTVQATAGGSLVNTTSTLTSNDPTAAAATATLTVFPTEDASFQIRYAANLNLGESYINIANDGANGASLLGPGIGGAVGNICVNVYAFDPSEELVSCCSCLVTPDQTVNLGVVADLTSKTLTGVVPTSVTVKLLATLAGTGTGAVCNNSAAGPITTSNIVPSGMAAWGTTLHAQGTGTGTTETPFTASTLSSGELASITGRCAAIIGNASGFGICASCRSGALGGQKL